MGKSPNKLELFFHGGPIILRLTVKRFRGIEALTWYPSLGLNVVLGGGDVGKSTILDAIALLLSPTNTNTLSDADFWRREAENGFEIEAVMYLPETCGINQQSKQAWPWDWNGKEPQLPKTDSDTGTATIGTPVYRLRARANSDFELTHELLHPDETATHLSVAVRRAIGVVRLGGDDRNDRDLRLVQGAALDRLLSDRTLRARLGLKLGEDDVEEQLKQDGKDKLKLLDGAFEKRSLPKNLGLGLTTSQGFSIGALIGLTADKEGVQLPLASWGAGTRRLASLEIAAACQGGRPITLVDELERGLEPYRLRVLVGRLQTGKSQVFLTTHSAVSISAATSANLWYLDSAGTIGSLPRQKVSRQQARDPETFLARLSIVAEGEAEKGFARFLLERAIPGSLYDRGIWITEGQGHESSLNLLEALAEGGLQFGGFVDNEGLHGTRWERLDFKLGSLLFQWEAGCLEENIIKLVPAGRLEDLIRDPANEKTGDRLRTLADRAGGVDKDFATIKDKVPDIVALIVEAATGRIPASKEDAQDNVKKALRKDAAHWFKSYDGGRELAKKMFDLGIWPQLKAQLLPFVNAVLNVENLPLLDDLS